MRKLACFAGSFSLGIFLAQYLLPASWLLPGAAVCFAIACGALLLPERWRRRMLLAGVGLALALGWNWLYVREVQSPMEALAWQERQVTMTLCAYPSATYCGAKATVRIEGIPFGKAVYYGDTSLLELCPGQTVMDTVLLRSAGTIRDDDITTFTSKGIFLLATSRGTPEAKAGSVGSPRWWPAELGRAMQLRIARLFTGDTAAFLTAILTGDRSGLSVRADSDLSEAGLSHILAVSGMHCMFLLRMIQDVTGKHRRRLVAGWGIPVLAFYALLTGGSPSVVRACVMVVFYLTAPLFGRDSDGPTALTSALFCILLVNPFAAASISLQLSFGAMAGLLWVSDRLYRMLAGQGKHGKIFCFTAFSISASVGALVFTWPLAAYYFGTLVLVSPLSNLLCLWAASGIFLTGLLTLGVSVIWLPLGTLFGLVPRLLIAYLLRVAHGLASLPYHALSMDNRYLWLWLIFVYALFAAAYLGRSGRRRRYALASVLAVVTLAASVRLWTGRYDDGRLHILALDVGQGASTLLCDSGSFALVDCGSSDSWYSAGSIAANRLRSMGCHQLDTLILTHYDTDHVNGVEELLALLPVKTLLVPDTADDSGVRERVLLAAAAHGTAVEIVTDTYTIPMGESTLQVYSTEGGETDNDSGQVLLCSRDPHDLLITGDLDAAVERRLLEVRQLPDIDILAVGHHGSASSTCEDLLDALEPETALISVGSGNSYGHPADETLRRLRKIGADIYRTDLQGTIELTLN